MAVNSVCAITKLCLIFLPLFAGVPQGTKLGPMAFQAVINDAAVGGTAHYWKYVDDLTFAENRLSNELSNLRGDLDDFLDWSVTNQLGLNPTKCQALQICFMRDPPPYPDLKIGQSLLAFVSSAKVLGVRLQNDLKWDTQVNYMNKNAAKRLFMLHSLKRFGFNKSELVTVYKGLHSSPARIFWCYLAFESHFQSDPPAWKSSKKGFENYSWYWLYFIC